MKKCKKEVLSFSSLCFSVSVCIPLPHYPLIISWLPYIFQTPMVCKYATFSDEHISMSIFPILEKREISLYLKLPYVKLYMNKVTPSSGKKEI